jgi:hypothetical protein
MLHEYQLFHKQLGSAGASKTAAEAMVQLLSSKVD